MSARAILLACAGLAFGPAAAQDLARADMLFGVAMTKAIVEEVRAQCVARYPQLKGPIEEAYAAWPLARTTISIKVNGKDYVSPEIGRLVEAVRAQFRADDEARNRDECEGFKGRLANLMKKMPMEALAPFIAPGP